MAFFQKKLRTVQEVAKHYGISIATVDHYVNMGLLDIAGKERMFKERFKKKKK